MFRSILPHEPPPTPSPSHNLGHVHVQGSFTPKTAKSNDKSDNNQQQQREEFWSSALDLQRALFSSLAERHVDMGLPCGAKQVTVLDTVAPFTKIRLDYDSPFQAQKVVAHCRRHQVSAADLLATATATATATTTLDCKFSARGLTWTLVTQQPLPEPSWPRSNPPKFRRLLYQPEHYQNVNGNQQRLDLERERQTTRFVFVTNLLPQDQANVWEGNVHVAAEALRSVFSKHDSSGLGVEIFVSSKKLGHCHVGMRSAVDAQRLIQSLQEQVVKWKWESDHDNNGDKERTMDSGRLFLDYAAITQRTAQKLEMRAQGQQIPKGEPSRPDCTSTTDHVHVPGLILLENFVSEQEQESLLAVLLGPHAPWAPSQSTPTEGRVVKRRVQHYGYVFDYETANVLRDRSHDNAGCPPLPVMEAMSTQDAIQDSIQTGKGWHVLAGIIERTRTTAFCDKTNNAELTFPNMNQMTLNHYVPGEGIGSHVDTPSAFGDGLLSLSLNGGIVMEFRKVEGGEHSKKLLYLPPRSLVIMSGPARYEWEHMIVTRRTDTVDGKVLERKLRVSLTFRTALALDQSPLPRVVSHKFPPKWRLDDQLRTNVSAIATPDCERDHVHKVYDAIATQWHHTRGRRGVLWPGATQFLERLPPGSVVADVGCGDGKYFPAIWEAGSYVVGVDMSRPLLQTCFGSHVNQENVPESRRISASRQSLSEHPAVAVADCMSVPFRTESCDAAICIAVLHHLSTEERRVRCVQELARIVKSGGFINIQAWSMDQENDSRRRFASEDVFVPFNAQPKYLQLPQKNDKDATGQSTAQVYAEAFENADFDDRKGLVVFQRYCHLYRKGELESIVAQVPSLQLVESGYESGNYFVIVQRKLAH